IKTAGLSRVHFFYIAAFCFLACMGLFWLDKDTHSLADLFKGRNILTWVLYFIPTFLLCCVLYYLFQKLGHPGSFWYALSIGVPVGLLTVIITLAFVMGRV